MKKILFLFIPILIGCGASINDTNDRVISDYVIREKTDTLSLSTFPPYIVSPGDKDKEGECGLLIRQYNRLGSDSIRVDVLPKQIVTQSLKYPTFARENQIEGKVCVRLWVKDDGTIRRAKVVIASNEIFVEPALMAAMGWKLSPAIKDGRPIEVSVILPFNFRLGYIR